MFGLWHLGEIYANGLAALGHTVTGIDEDAVTINNFLKGIPPLPEPGLAALMQKNRRAGRIGYSSDVRAVKECNVVWFMFDTPVNARDESNLLPIMKMVREAIPYFANDVLVVVSSQVPAGTSKTIHALIRRSRPKLKFHYAYCPENLQLGDAIRCFLHPERIVLGTEDDEAFRRMKEIFRGVHTAFIRMSPASAEMAKHALNAFFATSISFINDIADASEKTGADVTDVVAALRSDPRIGDRAALGVGLGFSGGTLGRDIVALKGIGRTHGIALPVIESVFSKNASRPEVFVGKLESLLGGLRKKRIVLFGLTYKPGTTTLRRSRSLEVASLLSKRGAIVVLSDHHVPQETIPRSRGMIVEGDPYVAVKGADALAFLTPWPDFRSLDFKVLAKSARPHAIVLDSSNLLYDREASIKKTGLRYHGIGR